MPTSTLAASTATSTAATTAATATMATTATSGATDISAKDMALFHKISACLNASKKAQKEAADLGAVFCFFNIFTHLKCIS